jgi:predicted aminopeptidase
MPPAYPDKTRFPGLAAAVRWLLLATALATLAGCAGTRYYWQSVHGHLSLMQAARPVDDWLSDPHTPAALRERLALSQRIRSFAVTELALPDNPSYRRYADLQRRAVVWNVVAAPELSLTLQTWCFPVLGCVGYRGYFDEAEAQALAAELRAQGLDVTVYGVPAYSTLGWMNWAGGDPLLNTFITYPEGELARIIFHELAHQVLYVPDDTTFNESFATAVEQLGGARWLAMQASDQARREYAEFDARRRQFRGLTLATRERLRQIYAVAPGNTTERARLLEQKQAAMAEFRSRYAALKASWGGYAGYDLWVARANNASFGAQAAYDELVPGFEALFEREGRDWRAFYDAVRRLADTPVAERRRALTNTRTSATEKARGHGG